MGCGRVVAGAVLGSGWLVLFVLGVVVGVVLVVWPWRGSLVPMFMFASLPLYAVAECGSIFLDLPSHLSDNVVLPERSNSFCCVSSFSRLFSFSIRYSIIVPI